MLVVITYDVNTEDAAGRKAEAETALTEAMLDDTEPGAGQKQA